MREENFNQSLNSVLVLARTILFLYFFGYVKYPSIINQFFKTTRQLNTIDRRPQRETARDAFTGRLDSLGEWEKYLLLVEWKMVVVIVIARWGNNPLLFARSRGGSAHRGTPRVAQCTNFRSPVRRRRKGEERRGKERKGKERKKKKKNIRALSGEEFASLRDPGTTWGEAFGDDARGIPREIGSIAPVFPRKRRETSRHRRHPRRRSPSVNVNRKMVAARRDGRDECRAVETRVFPGKRTILPAIDAVFTRGVRDARARATPSRFRLADLDSSPTSSGLSNTSGRE